jgi:DHA2 family multidrug resistance protein
MSATKSVEFVTPVAAPVNRLLLTVAVMASTVMQALDTTIATVALPNMQGQLGASSDEISWVLTSYLVSAAIMMPLTGYFADRFGRKRYLLAAIVGFVMTSMLCGVAQSLPQIVLFRLMQGACGASLGPLASAILADAYPLEERGKAMSLWSMGVMVGPVLGPSLGGWLTDMLSWRWAFYINLPIGIISVLLVMRYCPETTLRERRMDWTGLALMVLAIGGAQMVLDRGNDDDWFSSQFIIVTTLASAIAMIAYITHTLGAPRKGLFDITVFKDRNFMSAGLVNTMMGLSMFGSMFIQPILLEQVLRYPVQTAGLVMMPRGVATMISMHLTGHLVGRIDARLLVATGILFIMVGTFAMAGYNFDVSPWQVTWPMLLQGFGQGFVYVPLATLQFYTLRTEQISEAAGLASLMRTMGQSIGVSIVATLRTRIGQGAWEQLGGYLNPYNPALQSYLQAHGFMSATPFAAQLLGMELLRQSQMLALINVTKFIGWSCVVMLLFIPLVKPVKSRRVEDPVIID